MNCPRCDDPTATQQGEIFNCGICGLRVAHDVAQPRVVVEPNDDRRFINVRFEVESAEGGDTVSDMTTHKLDRAHAKLLAEAILSIT